jgi:hypothetical protein
VVQIMKTSVDTVAFVEGMARVSGLPVRDVLKVLDSTAFFAALSADYRVQEAKRSGDLNQREAESTLLEIEVGADGYISRGGQDDVEGSVMTDYLRSGII